MKLAFIVLSLGLSLEAQAQVSAAIKSAAKTTAKSGIELFKAGASKTVSMAAAKSGGVIMKVWQKNSVLAVAEKDSLGTVNSFLLRVEKMDGGSPRYEDKLIGTVHMMKDDSAKVAGPLEAKIKRIEVEDGEYDGAKMVRVYF